jgi:hypothetical protein
MGKLSSTLLAFAVHFLTGCSDSTALSNVPKVFVGRFCMEDFHSENKYFLNICNDSVVQGTFESGYGWNSTSLKIAKLIEKNDRLQIFTIDSKGRYSMFDIKIEKNLLKVYFGECDETVVENLDDSFVEYISEIGYLHKCSKLIED